jgi:hypothetical protein
MLGVTLAPLSVRYVACGNIHLISILAALQVPQQVVSVQVACMSKTGCEPNYKKTNQDNCFAFEKYIMADQALFGVIDGHGPNGETR